VVVWAAGSGAATADPTIRFLGGSRLFDHPGAWPRLIAAPHRIFGFFEASFSLLAEARRQEAKVADRVIAHWLFPAALPWALLMTPRSIPLELVVHGSDLQLALRLPSWALIGLLRVLTIRRGKLRFVSQTLKDSIRALRLPQDLARFFDDSIVAASPIEVPQVPLRSEARLRLGIAPEALLAVVVGRLIEGKRIDTALRAATLVPNLQTAVIGSGPLEHELRGRFPSTKFLGQLKRDDALLWIRAAELLISTSHLEGAPTAIREAIELQTPIVAVESGDLAEWEKSHDELYLVGAC
jgi:teichuronic acid biosynthesis glycosyltransferase TuaC